MASGQVRCLVTGATGYIGSRLVPKLLGEGHRVRALARNPSKLADVPWRERAEVVRGDLGDVDSLEVAFDGVDVVYYLVHSMGTSKDSPSRAFPMRPGTRSRKLPSRCPATRTGPARLSTPMCEPLRPAPHRTKSGKRPRTPQAAAVGTP